MDVMIRLTTFVILLKHISEYFYAHSDFSCEFLWLLDSLQSSDISELSLSPSLLGWSWTCAPRCPRSPTALDVFCTSAVNLPFALARRLTSRLDRSSHLRSTLPLPLVPPKTSVPQVIYQPVWTTNPPSSSSSSSTPASSCSESVISN